MGNMIMYGEHEVNNSQLKKATTVYFSFRFLMLVMKFLFPKHHAIPFSCLPFLLHIIKNMTKI